MTSKYTGQLVGFIRVSTLDQNTVRQEEQLEGFNVDAVFTDKASGKDTTRSELQAALKHLCKGDTFIVHSMDRLARNLDDHRGIIKGLTDKGCGCPVHQREYDLHRGVLTYGSAYAVCHGGLC